MNLTVQSGSLEGSNKNIKTYTMGVDGKLELVSDRGALDSDNMDRVSEDYMRFRLENYILNKVNTMRKLMSLGSWNIGETSDDEYIISSNEDNMIYVLGGRKEIRIGHNKDDSYCIIFDRIVRTIDTDKMVENYEYSRYELTEKNGKCLMEKTGNILIGDVEKVFRISNGLRCLMIDSREHG